MRGDMRVHSRWAAAALAAMIVFAPLSSASRAKSHHRGHPGARPAPQISQPEQSSQQIQPPPAPSSAVGSQNAAPEPPARLSAGKGALSVPPSLAASDIEAILGKSVRSNAGEDMGRLVDVIVDREGRPRAAIIDFGGFLGVGSRKIAVEWDALKFVPGDAKVVTVELTRDQLKAAPEFKEGSPVVAIGDSQSPSSAPAVAPQAQEN
jgi:sporulation protein YlmC with PRC-barrel domain